MFMGRVDAGLRSASVEIGGEVTASSSTDFPAPPEHLLVRTLRFHLQHTDTPLSSLSLSFQLWRRPARL